MLHFVLGRVRSGKTSYMINEIESRRERGTLFLVPEQRSHSMERLLCERCGNTVSGFAEVTSFRRLASKVKSETGGIAAEIVGGGRRILLMHSAIRAVLSSLKALDKMAGRAEMLEDLLSAIDEFKAYGVSPEKLARISGEVSENLGKKLSDLAVIYAAYESELGEDEYDAYDELAYIAESLKTSGFFNDKTLYLDGFSGFTAAEFDIIGTAISHARDVFIALELPETSDDGAENGIFDKAFKTKKHIERLARRSGAEYDEVYLSRKVDSALLHLDREIFSDEPQKQAPPAPEITVARADGAFEECEKSAAYILDRVREGARFRDFSVAVTEESEYLNVCERVFSRYQIPVYVSTAQELASKPVIALILAAFDCILRGFKTDAVMGYLKTGFSGVCARSLDIFENYLYTWSPKASEWAKGKGFVKNPFGISAEETDESRELLRVINRVRAKIYEPVIKLSDAIKKGKTGEKCAEALYDFINDIKLPRRVMAYAYLAEVSGRLSDAQEYKALLEILCDAIDSIGRTVGDKEIGVEEFYLLFKIVVSQYELGTIPASLDCVNVAGLDRADGERCKVRIVLGAQEGSFPKSSDSAGIISDNDRLELSDYGIELSPGMSERTCEAYRVMHSVLCSAEDALYISSSRLGRGGEEKHEAPVVSRIKGIFDGIGEGMTLREARLRAKVPCFDESVAARKLLPFWEKDEEYSEKLRAAKMNSNGKRGPILNRENIESVFGKKIRLSASRADVFSSCRYEYFLRYGLKASPRERAEINAIEAGTLMHYVLEKVLTKLSKKGDFGIEEALSLAETACREYVETALRGSGKLVGREEFLIRRLERTVKAAVEDICRELKKSKFRPREFELKFSGSDGDLPPLEIKGEYGTVLFRGAVDRVDVYETEDELFFRVIDYKSGKKEFSLDEAVNGIGMQMLLYMFALEEMGESRYSKPPQSAGVMYVPLAPKPSDKRGVPRGAKTREGVVLRDMRIIDAMEEGEKKEYLPVSITKSGGFGSGSMVLSKREFNAVKNRVKSILARIGDELSRGEIEPNPYVKGDRSACDWCDYKSVCAFDEERSDDRKRELIQTKLADIIGETGGEEDARSEMD